MKEENRKIKVELKSSDSQLSTFGLKAKYSSATIEAGCDEAGRGALAGPVVAAAVVLPENFDNKLINDSKQISEKKRETLRIFIEEKALSWAVAFVDNNEIDKLNILNATYLAMHRAISRLSIVPNYLIIDGNRFLKYKNIKHTCIVKGDAKYVSIAAASILAKTHRDQFMRELHKQYPVYAWDKNKAYGTKQHREAIIKHGTTAYHRKSFRLIDKQLKIDF